MLSRNLSIVPAHIWISSLLLSTKSHLNSLQSLPTWHLKTHPLCSATKSHCVPEQGLFVTSPRCQKHVRPS